MGFTSESGKQAGKSGGKHLKTKQWELLSKDICGKHADKFNDEINKLSGKDFVNAYTLVLKYFRPALQSTSFNTGDGDFEFKLEVKRKSEEA